MDISLKKEKNSFGLVNFRKDGGTLRTMTGDKLLKTLPVLQAQIDALLEFDCTSQVMGWSWQKDLYLIRVLTSGSE